MDRLQQKCIVASVGLHGLLVGAFLFGSAFLVPSSKTLNLEVLTVIPDVLTDAPSSNAGGNPNITQPPVSSPPVQLPVQTPAPPPPKPVKPEPAPVVKELPPVKSPEEADFTKPSPRRVAVNTNKVTRVADSRAKSSKDDAADERAQARAEAEARNRAKQALNRTLASIGAVASSSMAVEIPGPGGLAYANYAQYVKTVYTEAWAPPADITDDSAITKASVTIARDGTVISWKIVTYSGNSVMDASVRNTLERVRTIGREFPAGAKEDQRTFTISFNLKAKRQLG